MSYDSDVISATSGRGEPNWDLIIRLCNRIRDSVGSVSMHQAMGAVMKRVKHSDSNIQLHALTLLESCVSNCGKDFQLELTKPSFHSEVKALLTSSSTDPRVTQRIKDLLVNWIQEFRNETNMSGLVKFVEQLRKDGIHFPVMQISNPTSNATGTSTVLQSREDEDLRRAIQLSLQDSSTPGGNATPLYPSISTSNVLPAAKKVVKKKVRAIYDFTAAEDNELSFRAGEIIDVTDDSDENWWKGETHLGTGLFPASFVSTDLTVDPEPSRVEKKKKSSASSGKKTKTIAANDKKTVVNEGQIDLFLEMIKTADVTSEENVAENTTLLELEDQCKKMRPLVEENIAALQRQEEEMQEVSDKFQEALQLYRKLLTEGPRLSSGTQPLHSNTANSLQPPANIIASSLQPPANITVSTIQPPMANLPSYQTPSSNAQLDYTAPHQTQLGQLSTMSGLVPGGESGAGVWLPPSQSASYSNAFQSVSTAVPVVTMGTQGPAPPPYQPGTFYHLPQPTMVHKPLN